MPNLHLCAAAALLILAAAAPAAAHARLATAVPAPGSIVAAPPSGVSIDFTQGVEPQSSSILVQDGAGHPVDTGTAAAVPGDDKQLRIGLMPLGPGTYRVIWHATAVDSSTTEGTYQFMVRR